MATKFLRLLFIFILHWFTGYTQLVGSKQANENAQTRFETSKCIDDLLYLNAKLQDAHPCLYCYTDSLTLRQKFTSLLDSMERHRSSSYYAQLTESEFTVMVKAYLAAINDGHLDAGNYNSLSRYIHNRGRFFPLTLLFEGESTYIHHDFSGFLDSTVAGRQLISINNKPVSEILQQMYALSSADAGLSIFKTRQLESLERFNILYWMLYEPTDQYTIVYQSDTSQVTVHVPGITAKEIILANNQQKTRPTLTLHAPISTAYMDINSFEGISERNEVMHFWEFVDKSFKELNRNGTQNLIIDLRDNPGGMIYNAHLLLNYISQQNIESDFQVKSSQLLKEMKKQGFMHFLLRNFNHRSYASKIAHTPAGNFIRFSSRDHFIANEKLKFKGKVYLLVNGNSFSAAGLFAKFFQEHHLGTIVGEECGASPSFSFGNVVLLELPNTGLQVFVPTAIVVNDKSCANTRKGIMPDMPINRMIEEEVKGKDTVLQQLLETIGNTMYTDNSRLQTDAQSN
ncbi:hypothetical protein GXP67_18405 [Rhodocytophaga rosea]|uniref:Tail specific protease domain-containing protein n=1 Tax=Rhodocytophaga rosea TaxID=2704465 RepID=A0A6C0GLE6_9BACT|nr:S41 family peptidase [Rhodocytophaga rosea]QHT68473.1 hypothetical protein GXP67_18405 [Rhodocytophaga rosea]